MHDTRTLHDTAGWSTTNTRSATRVSPSHRRTKRTLGRSLHPRELLRCAHTPSLSVSSTVSQLPCPFPIAIPYACRGARSRRSVSLQRAPRGRHVETRPAPDAGRDRDDGGKGVVAVDGPRVGRLRLGVWLALCAVRRAWRRRSARWWVAWDEERWGRWETRARPRARRFGGRRRGGLGEALRRAQARRAGAPQTPGAPLAHASTPFPPFAPP